MSRQKWREEFHYIRPNVLMDARCACCTHREEHGPKDRCAKHNAWVSWFGLCDAFKARKDKEETDNA